jgi:hypothetical protein
MDRRTRIATAMAVVVDAAHARAVAAVAVPGGMRMNGTRVALLRAIIITPRITRTLIIPPLIALVIPHVLLLHHPIPNDVQNVTMTRSILNQIHPMTLRTIHVTRVIDPIRMAAAIAAPRMKVTTRMETKRG